MGPSVPSIEALRHAVEGRDREGMKALYARDAVLTIIDTVNPPSRPRTLRGAAEIGAWIADVCGREMTHEIELGVIDGNRLAFLERCTYPDGVRVVASCTAEFGPEGIRRQTTVQAWDN